MKFVQSWHENNVMVVILVLLLLNFNKFDTWLLYFHCWIWTDYSIRETDMYISNNVVFSLINSGQFFLFRNAFVSGKTNDSFGLIIYLNTVKLETKILAQINGRAAGVAIDPQQRKIYWINGITYVTFLKLLIKTGIYQPNRFLFTYQK